MSTDGFRGGRWIVSLALAIVLSAPGRAAEAPAMKAESRDATWIKGTEKVRDLLGKLDGDSPVVKRWLPAVRRRCAGLEKIQAIGAFERIVYVEMFEAMLEDLAAGRGPLTRYAGKTVPFGYWSDHLRRLTGVKLQVPPGYDPGKEHQLFMYYKLGGGLHWKKDGKYCSADTSGAQFQPPYRPTAEMCRRTPETFHAWSSLYYGLKGRMGCEPELREFLAAVCSDFAVSADRVFLSGFSDGGFTSLWLGSRYPHLVAGIVPEVANWQYCNVNQIGLYNVPVLVVDGWRDGGYVGENLARFHTLSTMGYDFAGLIGQHSHATLPYEDEETFKKIVAWAATKRRNLWPRRVRYATWNLRWHRSYWLGIERFIDPCLAAMIDAKVADGNRIEVKSGNVAAIKLTLSDKLLDLAKSVTVTVNGKQRYEGKCRAELLVEVVKSPPGKFAKTPAMPGGMTAAMADQSYDTGGFLKVPAQPWSWVRPTGGTEAQRAALADFVPDSAVDDTKVSESFMTKRNLFVIGGPGLNRLADRYAGDLPVKFEQGRFRIGAKVYDRGDHCVRFICPNPLAAGRYVIVFGFNDPVAAAKGGFGGAGREFFNLGPWGFRSGDAQVFPGNAPANPYGVNYPARTPADPYVFSASWGPPDATALGEVAETFDFTAIQRLKADAIREATGADVGITWGYPPNWNRWRSHLLAGPLTLHDLATVQMFPEYAMLVELTGAELKSLAGAALATTLRKHKWDPSYDPKSDLLFSQIDDTKTYTVATDYEACASGRLTYTVSPPKMPKVFYFDSVDAFNANEHCRFVGRNLRQSDVQTAEAMAAYVRKRKRVSPRPTVADLAQYIANPRTNEFGAYDWVHLAVESAFTGPNGQAQARRETFGLALQIKGEPSEARPRAHSKLFGKVDTRRSGEVTLDISELDKKLPVRLTADVRHFGLAGPQWKLTDPKEAKAGRVALIRLKVTNTGPKELSGLAVLGATEIRRTYGGSWPERLPEGSPKPYYLGFMDVHGQRKKPDSASALLMLSTNEQIQADKLAMPNSGYNRGTIGLSRSVVVRPNATLELPLLAVCVARLDPKKPELPDLAEVLAAIKPSLTRAAFGADGK